MTAYAFLIEYDGSPFRGWQIQADQPSVQGRIEEALANIGEPGCSVVGAGRTDSGVHALGMVAHVHLSRDWDPFRLSEALNYHLRPDPIAILRAASVAADFHARFDALSRAYLYRILHRRAPLTLGADQVWRIGHGLQLAPMQEAVRFLVGKHDFTTFRSSFCQAKSPVKTLDQAEIRQIEGPWGAETQFRFKARSFLHNQIRSFVGTLEKVGNGSWPPERVAKALAARDRAACGPVAPPDGLYFLAADYPIAPLGN